MATGPGHLKAPETVFLEVTERCTFRCRHCFGRYGGGRRVQVTYAFVKRLIEELAQSKVFRFVLGGGEPLLYPDLIRCLSLAVRRLPYVSVSTNGFLAGADSARKLAGAGLKHIQVSIDGATAQSHNCVRSNRHAFARAVEAIGAFVKAGMRVTTSTVVTKHNVDEIPALYRLCADLGVDACRFLPLGLTGRALDFPQLTPGLEACAAAVKQIERLAARSLKDARSGPAISLNRRLQVKADPAAAPAGGSGQWDCDAARRSLGVLADGTVVPCVPLGKLGVSIGNLNRDHLSDTWNGPAARAFRRRLNHTRGPCNRCRLRPRCRGGCKANVLAAYGRLGRRDPDMRGICP